MNDVRVWPHEWSTYSHTHTHKLNNKVSHRQNSSFYQTLCCPHGGKSYVSEQKKKKKFGH